MGFQSKTINIKNFDTIFLPRSPQWTGCQSEFCSRELCNLEHQLEELERKGGKMIEMPEEQLCRLLDEIEEQNKCKKKENRCEKQRKREKYKRGKERRICKRNQNKFKKQRKRRRCKRVHKQKSCRYSLKLDGKRKRRTSDLGTIRFNIRNTSRIPRAGTVSKGLNCSEVKTKREKRGMIAFAGFTICFASVSSLV